MRTSSVMAALLGALALMLAGCTTTHIIKLYDGPERDPSEIALLYVDPQVMVTRVDKIIGHPSGSTRALVHSVEKRREIAALAPGRHDLVAYYFLPRCVQSDSGLPLRFMAEAGKKYRLKPQVNVDRNRWKLSVVDYSGERIEGASPA